MESKFVVGQAACVRAILIRDSNILVVRRNKFGEQYYTLPGGHIDHGELPRDALVREVKEETSFRVTSAREVFYEPASEPFFEQYIYLCDFTGTEPRFEPDSEEAISTAEGNNTYHLEWLNQNAITKVVFRSDRLQEALAQSFEQGWPDRVVQLTSR